MEGSIATTYALIYRFLKQQSQIKAAEAVKKAAKAVVVLRDDVEQEGPPLEDIIKAWRTMENTKSGDADSSSEDSGSSDEDKSSSDSSSEDTSGDAESDDTSDSDDGSDDSDKDIKAKKLPKKGVERDTSVTLSSVGENAREVSKQGVRIPEKKSTRDKDKSTESDSSDSDSSSQSSASDSSDAETSSSSPDPSGSSDSSDENEVNANEKAPSNRTRTTNDKSSSSSGSSSDSEDESDSESQLKEDTHVAKKRKTSESGAAMVTGSQQIAKASQKKESPPARVKERFQRVKVQNLPPELILNNGYEARGGATNDYGERAHRDLIVTRGAGFRKEKNKKKRGSYRGGEITMESRSIRFDF